MPQYFDDISAKADDSKETSPTGLEPELGGDLRGAEDRSGLEPELGGVLRQNGVYVDELTCIGCKHCAHVARNTFYIEPDYGRARAIRQDGDTEEVIQEAMDTCPVNCIHWVDYTELKQLERERKDQVIPIAGFPVDKAMARSEQRKRQKRRNRPGRRSSSLE
ncbi:ferredoxin [Oscillatoria sp. CS-180]|uniref:ferredoxin n=1 Tax=Oscillatoria sp. CS-180 TaxID=3021720 RepID=UPI00232F5662|nr:ferredoxin [Oscillatoria sp. CS-180]MDB9525176.1 ferredoxin [Oscillatoria sp. CS-180]